MRRRWILGFALAAFAAAGASAQEETPPRVELPLGPYVRPGRPLDVRVVGGADRVRAPGTPWALPQGDRGDEFILQLTDATVGVLSLEIDRGGRVTSTSLQVLTLPAGAVVVGIPAGATSESCGVAVPSGARVLTLERAGLPTVPEGWLLLDVVAAGLAPDAAREALARLARLPAAARAFAEPLLFPPDPVAFRVAAEAASRAPALPGDVFAALALLAATEVGLAAILALRRDSPWRRAAWLSAPAAAALAFVLAGGRLPGALRADAMLISGGRAGDLVVVRVAARRDASAGFDLPASAGAAAVLRYAADDPTAMTVSAGRRVEMELTAGQSRLFAYRVAPGSPAAGEAGSPPPALEAWLLSLGQRPAERGRYGFPSDALPRGVGARVVAGFQVSSRPVPPTK